MGLSSFFFIFILLPAIVAGYALVPQKGRHPLLPFLLLASLLFYTWLDALHLPFIVLFALLNFAGGRWVQRLPDSIAPKTMVTFNLLVLLFYKLPLPDPTIEAMKFILSDVADNPVPYSSFLQYIALELRHVPSITVSPLGISFLTFTAIAYIRDIQHKQHDAERSLVRFGVFLLFFPKIVAGPIARYASVHNSLSNQKPDLAKVAQSIERFILGLAKKILVADVLGEYVVIVFAQEPHSLSPALAWTGIVFYTAQILYDFAGYSDMAIGTAGLLGIKLPKNFDRPYASVSISEFWRNWHITLSEWFRDYVYYPLEWRCRRSPMRNVTQYSNILVVFLLTGLWHGLAAHYAAWGLLHGAALAFERTKLYGRWRKCMPRTLQQACTLVLVMVGWVFFRAPTFPYAIKYFMALNPFSSVEAPLPLSVMPPISGSAWLALIVAAALSLPRTDLPKLLKFRGRLTREQMPRMAKSIMLLALFILTVIFMASGTVQPVLYGGF